MIAVFFLFGGALTSVILSGMFNLMMIGEINRKKAQQEQVSYFGYTPVKAVRIVSEYRRLYPTGRLHVVMLAAFGLGACLLVSLVIVQALFG